MKQRRSRRFRVAFLAIFLSASLGELCVSASGCRKKISGLPLPDEWMSVEVVIRDHKNIKTLSSVATSTDPVALKRLALLMHDALEKQDHKCMDTGRMIVGLHDGGELNFNLLSGHDDSHFEFRYGRQLYYVQRSEFSDAMRSIGWTQFPTSP